MDKQVHMGLMSWTEYRDRVASSDPVVLIPVGSVEQHGPHLPLATDSLIPAAICEASARTNGALVAPTLSYGYKSLPRCGGGQHFCGTTSLDAATLIAQIKDITRDLTRHGVCKLAFVVGHMENQWLVNEACDLALRKIRMLGLEQPRIMNAPYWEFLAQKTIDEVFGNVLSQLAAGARRDSGDIIDDAHSSGPGSYGKARGAWAYADSRLRYVAL